MTETTTKFIEAVDDLEHMTGIAMTLSLNTHEREVDSWREEYCSYIFAKLCMHAQSVLLVRPKAGGSLDRYEKDVWDISSLAVIARALIDSYYVFFYLGIDQADKDEIDFRFILWRYHSEQQRLDMLKRIRSTNPVMKELEKDVEKLLRELSNSSFYKLLKPDVQRKIRKGEIGIYHSNTELSKRAGIDPGYYKAIYNDLSAYVHAYPYALSQLRIFRANDNESLAIITTIINMCVQYVCYAVRDFIILMPDQDATIDQRGRLLINEWGILGSEDDR